MGFRMLPPNLEKEWSMMISSESGDFLQIRGSCGSLMMVSMMSAFFLELLVVLTVSELRAVKMAPFW